MVDVPAMPKGIPKPTARIGISHTEPPMFSDQGALTHEPPVSPEEVLRERIEGNIGPRSIRIMVRGSLQFPSRMEAPATHNGVRADGGTGVHLGDNMAVLALCSQHGQQLIRTLSSLAMAR